jgi:hypothetical protein
LLTHNGEPEQEDVCPDGYRMPTVAARRVLGKTHIGGSQMARLPRDAL